MRRCHRVEGLTGGGVDTCPDLPQWTPAKKAAAETAFKAKLKETAAKKAKMNGLVATLEAAMASATVGSLPVLEAALHKAQLEGVPTDLLMAGAVKLAKLDEQKKVAGCAHYNRFTHYTRYGHASTASRILIDRAPVLIDRAPRYSILADELDSRSLSRLLLNNLRPVVLICSYRVRMPPHTQIPSVLVQ